MIIVTDEALDGARGDSAVLKTNPLIAVMLCIPAVAAARLFAGAAEWRLPAHDPAVAAMAATGLWLQGGLCPSGLPGDGPVVTGFAALAIGAVRTGSGQSPPAQRQTCPRSRLDPERHLPRPPCPDLISAQSRTCRQPTPCFRQRAKTSCRRDTGTDFIGEGRLS